MAITAVILTPACASRKRNPGNSLKYTVIGSGFREQGQFRQCRHGRPIAREKYPLATSPALNNISKPMYAPRTRQSFARCRMNVAEMINGARRSCGVFLAHQPSGFIRTDAIIKETQSVTNYISGLDVASSSQTSAAASANKSVPPNDVALGGWEPLFRITSFRIFRRLNPSREATQTVTTAAPIEIVPPSAKAISPKL